MLISVAFGVRAPIAAPSLEANSGVNSTLIRPFRPYELNRPRFHEPAQMIDSWTTAPGSTSLLGQIRTFGLMVEPAPITTSLPMTLPSSRRQPFLIVTDFQTPDPPTRHFNPIYLSSQSIEI